MSQAMAKDGNGAEDQTSLRLWNPSSAAGTTTAELPIESEVVAMIVLTKNPLLI